MKREKENFTVPMKKRKLILQKFDCSFKTDNVGLLTSQSSDSKNEDEEVLLKKYHN